MAGYALDGKAVRKKNNALSLQFIDGNGPVATALQSGDDGRKARMAILMGWRNGGAGRHAVDFADGRRQIVEVSDEFPVRVFDGANQELATIAAGAPSSYRSADGAIVLSLEADGEPTPGKVPMLVRRERGDILASVADVRTNTEWKARDSLRAAADLYMLVTASGAGSLPMKRFGTQISSDTSPTQAEVDALIAISVAICIGMCDLVPQHKR